jgi:hypothetical protein
MNANLLNVIKQITAQYGDSILSEPKRVSAFLADLARDEPKPHKNALVKCLEHGFAQTLKNVPESDRANCKQRLAQKLHDEEGLDLGLCNDTLDLLAVLFGYSIPQSPLPTPTPVVPPVPQTAPPAPMPPPAPKNPRNNAVWFAAFAVFGIIAVICTVLIERGMDNTDEIEIVLPIDVVIIFILGIITSVMCIRRRKKQKASVWYIMFPVIGLISFILFVCWGFIEEDKILYFVFFGNVLWVIIAIILCREEKKIP